MVTATTRIAVTMKTFTVESQVLILSFARISSDFDRSFRVRYLLFAQLLFLAMPLVAFARVTQEQVNVRLVTDEAEAVLNILAKKKANEPIPDTDWQQLFATEGYVRLKQRETSMQRSFEDADFKTFVLSDQLAEPVRARRVDRRVQTS